MGGMEWQGLEIFPFVWEFLPRLAWSGQLWFGIDWREKGLGRTDFSSSREISLGNFCPVAKKKGCFHGGMGSFGKQQNFDV